MNFFKNISNPNEIKKIYREICFKFHPDLTKDTAEKETRNEIMKELNAQYTEALQSANGKSFVGTDNKDHVYRYAAKVERAVMDKIYELIHIKAMHGKNWHIELIGTWIWVSETEKKDKDLLNKNGAGLKWHSKRMMWYFRIRSYRRKMSNLSTDELREAYGSETLQSSIK